MRTDIRTVQHRDGDRAAQKLVKEGGWDIVRAAQEGSMDRVSREDGMRME